MAQAVDLCHGVMILQQLLVVAVASFVRLFTIPHVDAVSRYRRVAGPVREQRSAGDTRK